MKLNVGEKMALHKTFSITIPMEHLRFILNFEIWDRNCTDCAECTDYKGYILHHLQL
jgi:hypothetical protein